jgi:hypothetical protein
MTLVSFCESPDLSSHPININLSGISEDIMYRLNQIQEHEAYRAEIERRAVRRRMVREALAGRRGRAAFYAPMLAGIGKTLMAWGYALQARYHCVPDVPMTIQKRVT